MPLIDGCRDFIIQRYPQIESSQETQQVKSDLLSLAEIAYIENIGYTCIIRKHSKQYVGLWICEISIKGGI